MGCEVMIQYYLQFFEEKFNDNKFEFACETQSQMQQNNVSYFFIDLDDFHSESRLYSDNKYHKQTKKDQPSSTMTVDNNEQKSKKNKNNNIIAGIIYQKFEHLSENIKDFILSLIKQSIYFKTKQYENGFNNLMISIQDYINSKECNSSSVKQIYHTNYEQVFNLLMKVDNDIYLSKPFKGEYYLQNCWTYSSILSGQYSQINIETDLINKTDEQYYKVKNDVSKKIKEIILYSSKVKHNTVIKDVRKLYPTYHDEIYLFFLKLQLQ